jgi:hypothetical protein
MAAPNSMSGPIPIDAAGSSRWKVKPKKQLLTFQ